MCVCRVDIYYSLLAAGDTSSSPYRAIFVRITVYPVYDQIMQVESRRSCTVFTKSLRESPAASNDTCMVLITRSKQSMVSNRHERQNMQRVATHNADHAGRKDEMIQLREQTYDVEVSWPTWLGWSWREHAGTLKLHEFRQQTPEITQLSNVRRSTDDALPKAAANERGRV